MRNFFNNQVQSNPTWKAVEGNLGIIMMVSLSGAFLAATAFGPELKQDRNVPEWVNDFQARPKGMACQIKDLKSGKEFAVKEGNEITLPRGFSVSSSPSSCNVKAPDGKTCQLRGWPVRPIC